MWRPYAKREWSHGLERGLAGRRRYPFEDHIVEVDGGSRSGAAQPGNLGLRQIPPAAGWQVTQFNRPDASAPEIDDGRAHRLQRPAHDSVAALVNRDLDGPAIV